MDGSVPSETGLKNDAGGIIAASTKEEPVAAKQPGAKNDKRPV
jgi:hypothetical protein